MSRITDYAYIETTNHCNLACTFCNRADVIGALQHMPLFKFRQVLDKLGPDLKEAKLMGMGEPFLHPNFDSICKMFKEKYPDSFLISSTNAQYNANERVANSLKYLDMLYISIDGFEDTYEQFRPPSKWSKLIKYLEAIAEMPRYNCKIAINYTVNPGNIVDIQKVYEMLATYKLDELRLNLVQNWDEDADVESTVEEYSDEQIAYLKNNWGSMIKGRKEWDFSDCFWVQRGAYVTVEGNMKVCCMNTAAKPIQNIFFVKNAREVFESKAFEEIKIGCETNNPTDHCRTCSYKELLPLLQRVI
jgi:MoaA/NifB/PqqE/SkfB family radical SAM enzyme